MTTSTPAILSSKFALAGKRHGSFRSIFTSEAMVRKSYHIRCFRNRQWQQPVRRRLEKCDSMWQELFMRVRAEKAARRLRPLRAA